MGINKHFIDTFTIPEPMKMKLDGGFRAKKKGADADWANRMETIQAEWVTMTKSGGKGGRVGPFAKWLADLTKTMEWSPCYKAFNNFITRTVKKYGDRRRLADSTPRLLGPLLERINDAVPTAK